MKRITLILTIAVLFIGISASAVGTTFIQDPPKKVVVKKKPAVVKKTTTHKTVKKHAHKKPA